MNNNNKNNTVNQINSQLIDRLLLLLLQHLLPNQTAQDRDLSGSHFTLTECYELLRIDTLCFSIFFLLFHAYHRIGCFYRACARTPIFPVFLFSSCVA